MKRLVIALAAMFAAMLLTGNSFAVPGNYAQKIGASNQALKICDGGYCYHRRPSYGRCAGCGVQYYTYPSCGSCGWNAGCGWHSGCWSGSGGCGGGCGWRGGYCGGGCSWGSACGWGGCGGGGLFGWLF